MKHDRLTLETFDIFQTLRDIYPRNIDGQFVRVNLYKCIFTETIYSSILVSEIFKDELELNEHYRKVTLHADLHVYRSPLVFYCSSILDHSSSNGIKRDQFKISLELSRVNLSL